MLCSIMAEILSKIGCNFGADMIKYISIIFAPVAQLDRAIASDAMCRAFESHQAYQ